MTWAPTAKRCPRRTTPTSDNPIDADTDIGSDDAGDTDAAPARRAVGGPWGRVAEKWVPDSLRDARVDPGRRGAVLLTVVAAVAAVVAAIGVWRDRPETRPVQPVALAPATTGAPATAASTNAGSADAARAHPGSTPAASGARASPGAGSPAGTTRTSADSATATSTPSTVYVSVTGLVRKPGLVRLAAGSRVADAIEAAGGVTEDGDVTGMNLAALLSDGDSVVVGGSRAASVSGTVSGTAPPSRSGSGSGGGNGDVVAPVGTDSAATPVNLNQADQAALESLPGVGPVMAGNILAWRDEHGSFTSVEQLQEVSGIGPTRYAQLAPLVTV